MKKAKIRLIILLILATLLSVFVLLSFHILMKKSSFFINLDFFSSPIKVVFLFVSILFLGLFQLSLLSTCRIRNESVSVVTFFVSKGLKIRYLKGILICFLTCLSSFLMGLALGGEAPSVYMSSLCFGLVFSFSRQDETRLTRAIKVGASVGFSLAFANPLAGIFYSFIPSKWHKSYFKNEYKLIIEGCLCSILGYLLYSSLKGLLYFNDYKDCFYKAFLFNEFNNSLFNLSLSSLSNYWIFILIPLICLPLGYLFVHFLGLLRFYHWKEKAYTYLISLLGALVLISLFRLYIPSCLGTGAAIIETNLAYLEKGIVYVLELFLARLILILFSFSSHFSGGNIIPTLSIGNIMGVIFSYLFSLALNLDSNEMLLITYAFMLSFFCFVSNKREASLALLLSFGPSLPLFLALLPSIFIEFFAEKYIKGFISLNKEFATRDIKNNSYAKTLWRHYPLYRREYEEIWERVV